MATSIFYDIKYFFDNNGINKEITSFISPLFKENGSYFAKPIFLPRIGETIMIERNENLYSMIDYLNKNSPKYKINEKKVVKFKVIDIVNYINYAESVWKVFVYLECFEVNGIKFVHKNTNELATL